MRLAHVLKRQADRQFLTAFSDPDKLNVTMDDGTGSGLGYNNAYTDTYDILYSENDPFSQYATVGEVDAKPSSKVVEFFNNVVWQATIDPSTLQQGATSSTSGGAPIVNVYTYPEIKPWGFGTFGTIPFGGQLGSVVQSTASVQQIDQQTIQAGFGTATSGKMVILP